MMSDAIDLIESGVDTEYGPIIDYFTPNKLR